MRHAKIWPDLPAGTGVVKDRNIRPVPKSDPVPTFEQWLDLSFTNSQYRVLKITGRMRWNVGETNAQALERLQARWPETTNVYLSRGWQVGWRFE